MSAPIETEAGALLVLTDCLGAPVVDREGEGLGRLDDLIVDPGGGHRPVRSILVKRDRRSTTEVAWTDVASLGDDLRLSIGRDALTEVSPRPGIHLRRDVLDTQIVDLSGRRVVRVGDVVLLRDASRIRLAGVETGPAAVLRRLGLRGVSRRLAAELVDWDELHPLSGRGHALQLDTTAARLHRLDPVHLAELIHHLPAPRSEEVLERMHPERASRVRHLLRLKRARRRYGRVLHHRRRAPS